MDANWRIEMITGQPLRLSENGRIIVPLWLLRNERHHADLSLTLPLHEAESLHARLCRLLATANGEQTEQVPPCR
ncbi:hypothetical protein JJV70_00245 [Streptomyces sp. JJ66]|uniref:hypothetical protein n=1 Tax=Streptomyces sp. JJ66 TaxID=2803843 RepID=UPI001C575646|nr:hypothetical protein [Streptomyces sp. JJ66]MBW1600556.1 hypothetical protein [Streptomyces sp. JJ66]